MKIDVSSPSEYVPEGERVEITVSDLPDSTELYDCTLYVGGRKLEQRGFRGRGSFELKTADFPEGEHEIVVRAKAPEAKGGEEVEAKAALRIQAVGRETRFPASGIGPVPVTLRRHIPAPTNDLPFWLIIRNGSEALSFNNYARMMDIVLCHESVAGKERGKTPVGRTAEKYEALKGERFLPFTDVDDYRKLKIATEAFLVVNCATPLKEYRFDADDTLDLASRTGVELNQQALQRFWRDYLEDLNGTSDVVLPYLALVRKKLGELGLEAGRGELPDHCYTLLQEKFTAPCLLELIWSYWHEEGMLVQTVNAVSRRFQNIRGAGERDPLAHVEIDPLRPLNNLLWGYIQDEQHRLNIKRRAYEYDHHYGLRLVGKAVPALRPADSRSKFIEAFHRLLQICSQFFAQADDTTVVPDGFPVLNALKEVHLLLTEGMHNQFGDLPTTARIEMLMQQWLLARPEFREFLPSRVMTVFGEAWMDRVETMKKLQGWTDTSIIHFRDLATFGERLLLSVRFGAWNEVYEPDRASHWAHFWRAEIQGYIHAYRAATGVELTRAPANGSIPSVLLAKRLAEQSARRRP